MFKKSQSSKESLSSKCLSRKGTCAYWTALSIQLDPSSSLRLLATRASVPSPLLVYQHIMQPPHPPPLPPACVWWALKFRGVNRDGPARFQGILLDPFSGSAGGCEESVRLYRRFFFPFQRSLRENMSWWKNAEYLCICGMHIHTFI